MPGWHKNHRRIDGLCQLQSNAATTPFARLLITGDKDFSDRGHTENLALPVQNRRAAAPG